MIVLPNIPNWQEIPFFRILLPFIPGIILAFYNQGNDLLLQFHYLLFLISFILFAIWSFKRQLSWNFVQSGIFIFIINVFLLGFILSYWSQPLNSENHFSKKIHKEKSILFGRLVSEPKQSGSIIRAELQVLKSEEENTQKEASGKILLSFKLDSLSSNLKFGDGIVFSSKIKHIQESENPNAFNQKFYYQKLGIYHQSFLTEKDWKRCKTLDLNFNYWGLLIKWRKKLNETFDQYLIEYPNEHAVASALILGSRASFSKELVNAYADTGATHVLSVSGLHVGLLATLLSLIFNKISSLRKNNNFKKIELFSLLSIIWFYALISGASAAVLRSAVMFSFILIGKSMSRKISIYNSLAASAFVLLLFQPNLIWDIGFQLSYLALTGIVFFHPIIYKQIYFKNFITDWIWNITAVGIAAQIVTLPLSLFYFHQFPSYFWLSGLVVIPLSTVALYAGFALLLFSWVPVLNFIIAKILYFSIYLMNALVFLIQKIPLSVIDYFNVSILEMWLMYFIIIASIMALILKRKYWTFIGLSTILFIIVINIHYKISNYNEDKIYVYKLNKGTMLDFFYKNIAVTLVDSSINSKSKIDFINYNNIVKHNISKLNLTTLFNDEFENSNIKIDKNGLVQFKNIKLALPPKIILNEDIFLSKKPIVDYLILTSNPRIKDLNHLENIFNYKILVFDASNSQYRISKWINQCKTLGIPFIDCSYKGKDILTALKK